MGQENSKPEDSPADGVAKLVLNDTEDQFDARGPSSAPKASVKPAAKSKSSQWLTPKANKHGVAERRPGTTVGLGFGRGAERTSAPQMRQSGEVVEEEQEEQELTPEQKKARKKEDAKVEMIGRMNNFIKSTAKLPESLMSKLPRAATPPDSKSQLQTQEATRVNWRGKLGNSKAEALIKIQSKLETESYLPPMDQESVGSKVEAQFGDTMETFTNFQGAVTTFIDKGLTEDALEPFLFDEEAEKQLTTYQKWAVVRNAAEQVLQVYANRANANWIESEEWLPPSVIDKESSAAGVYAGSLDSAITQGQIALFFIDDGRLCETGGGACAPILSMDLWQTIKELAPHKVPSAHRLERLSYMGRHLLHASVSIEMWYGASALKHLKVVLGVDCEQEQFMLSQLQQWGFFNLLPENVAVLPLPRFHGFAEDPVTGRLAHVKNSPKLMLGSGYAMFLLNSPAEAYTLTPDMEPKCLEGTVLEWLRETNSNWLMAGLFCDIDRLRPEALFDTDFLTAAMYAVERGGANMAMEVQMCKEERDMRTYDSVVLSRAASSVNSPLSCSCNLRPSAMRTVRSYQVLQSYARSDKGTFCSSTHRYVFKVTALQKMLIDPTVFHADIRLFDFYAYATFDLGDITTFLGARCSSIVSRGEAAKGPDMSSVVYGKPWLVHAASVLEIQDRVDEFRSKAIDLITYEQLTKRPSHPVPSSSARVSMGTTQPSTFQERKQGVNILLLLSPEHGRIMHAALKLAKLFVHDIVDKLHIVLLGSSTDSVGDMQVMLKALADKELEFNGQLTRQIVVRPQDRSTMDTIMNICTSTGASLVVVPSMRLAGPLGDLGALASSLAFCVSRLVVHIPVLVVKANTVGKWSVPGQYHPHPEGSRPSGDPSGLTAMCLLESTHVTPMVEFISKNLSSSRGDILYLAKTNAYEVPGQLSMRSRRVFVQARMAVTSNLRVEERAYAHSAVLELPKAVDLECADILVVSVNGELPISRDIEDLLKSVRTSVFIFRDKDGAIPQSGTGFSIVDQGEEGSNERQSRPSGRTSQTLRR